MSQLAKYYQILGLPATASTAEVKRAYRKLAMLYHPDKNESAKAKELFLMYTQAYEIILGDQPVPSARATSTSNAGSTTQSRSTSSRSTMTQEERIKRAQEYQRVKAEQEQRNLLNLYNKITQTFRWKIYQASALFFCLFSIALIIDDFLPTFYDVEEFNGYTSVVEGFKSTDVVGVNFKSGNRVYVYKDELFNHEINALVIEQLKNANIDVANLENTFQRPDEELYQVFKSSWLHTDKQVCVISNNEKRCMELDRNVDTMRYVLVVFFLLPMLNLLFKRFSNSFIIRYYLTQYVVVILGIICLLGNNRWLHFLTGGVF